MKNKNDSQIQNEITKWLVIQNSKKSNPYAWVLDAEQFSSNRYFWELTDCEENCWRYDTCELAEQCLRLSNETYKKQSNLIDDPTKQKEKFQQSIKEYRETIGKMESHYKQGWAIKKQGSNSWVKSLEY